jgi:hypothetical protein
MRRFIADGLRIPTSSLVLYEWWGGPRLPDELRDQGRCFREPRRSRSTGLSQTVSAPYQPHFF